MSAVPVVLRPAVDTRPPPERWAGPQLRTAAEAARQPPLQLTETPSPTTSSPAPGRLPVRVDLGPAGLRRSQVAELEEQVRRCAPWFAQLLLEAVEGRRPLEPLSRWLDDWVLAEVGRQVRRRRRDRATPVAGPAAGGGAAPDRGTAPGGQIVSVRAQLVQPRAIEVAAHLRHGRRSSAWAFRLVRTGDRWRCTALVVG